MTAGDGTYALRAAVRARLVADAGVKALVAGRVYARAPQNVAFPWIEIGASDDRPWEDGGCIDGLEINLTIHVWAQSQQAVAEVSQINAAIRSALHNQKFPLVGQTLHSSRVLVARSMEDPDGMTQHGVVSLEAYTSAL